MGVPDLRGGRTRLPGGALGAAGIAVDICSEVNTCTKKVTYIFELEQQLELALGVAQAQKEEPLVYLARFRWRLSSLGRERWASRDG